MPIQQILLILLLYSPLQDAVSLEYTPAGNKIERTVHEYSHYTLRWGNQHFMRSLPDTFNTFGLNNPGLWYESNLYLLLNVNLMQGGSSVFVLPLNDSSQIARFNDPIVFNPKLNLLAYIHSPRTIKIIELSSGKTSSLIVPLPRGVKDLRNCIQSTTLTGTELYIHWVDTPRSTIKIYRFPKLKSRHAP